MFKLTNKPMLLTRTNLEESVTVSVGIVVNILLNDYSRSRMALIHVALDYTIIYMDCSEPYFNLIRKGLI